VDSLAVPAKREALRPPVEGDEVMSRVKRSKRDASNATPEKYVPNPRRWLPQPYEIAAVVEHAWTPDLEAGWSKERLADSREWPARMIAEFAIENVYREWRDIFAPEYALSRGVTPFEIRHQYGRLPNASGDVEPPPPLHELIALLIDGTLLAWFHEATL